MSKIKKYKSEEYEEWLGMAPAGVAIDESSTKDAMERGEIKERFDDVLNLFSQGICSADYSEYTLQGGEKVKGSLEGAIHNIVCILNCLPENRRQDFANGVIYNVAHQFLKVKDTKDYKEKFASVMEKLSPYMKGQKISLSYLAYKLSEKGISSDEQKKEIQERIDYLASKYNESFEKPEKFIETVTAYSKLKQKIQDCKKSYNEESVQELHKALVKFDTEGYKLSFWMMTDLFNVCDKEINNICKKHWDVYNGGERNKYRVFDELVREIMLGIQPKITDQDSQRDRTKKELKLKQEDVARDFISSLSNDDIKNMLDIYIERLEHNARKYDLSFILLLSNSKIKEVAVDIKLPIFGVMVGYEVLRSNASDQKLAIANFETLLLNDSFIGKDNGKDGFISIYLHDLVNDSQKSDEQKNELVTKLITRHEVDIEYVLRDKPDVNKDNLKKITEHAKDDLAKLREEKKLKSQKREKANNIEPLATQIADELTKAAIGDKFAGQAARNEIKKGIKDSLITLSKEATHVFEKLQDETKRGEVIEKFKESIKKEPIVKEAKTTDGLVRAIVDRFINLLAMLLGQESLGQLRKGRITGFDDSKKQSFVDKLKANETLTNDKTMQR